MKIVRVGKWVFMLSELKWLEEQALRNELAADVLANYSRKYGRRRLTGWRTLPRFTRNT